MRDRLGKTPKGKTQASATRTEILTRNPAIPESDSPLFIGSLSKAVRVLNAFGGSKARLSATEIARLSGLGPSAAQRFIYTLTHLGFLDKDHRTKHYQLSARLLDFAYLYLRSDPLTSIAHTHLARLSHDTDFEANLSILDDADVIYVQRAPGRRRRDLPSHIGGRMPSFCTSNGRVLLAALPRQRAEAIVADANRTPLTAKTLTDPRDILAKIDEARRSGFAIVEEESEANVVTLAVPVCDRHGDTVAAINLVLPPGDKPAARAMAPLIDRLRGCADELGAALAGVDIFSPTSRKNLA